MSAFALSPYIKISNLFDRKNNREVYSSSGTADFDYDIVFSNYRGYGSKEEWFIQPNFYDEVRKILFGVSFALLDLAEAHQIDLSDVVIMETGGMKGRRKEMTREELHISDLQKEKPVCEWPNQPDLPRNIERFVTEPILSANLEKSRSDLI